MGNLRSGSVKAELGLLTNWTLVEIKALFRVYWTETTSRSQKLPLQLFNYVISKSPISKSVRLFPHFDIRHTGHAHMLEFFTAVTLFAWSSFSNKAKRNAYLVLFKLFDFNDDNVLSYEELKALIQTVIAALSIMQGSSPDLTTIDAITEGLFTGEAKKHGDEMTFEDFAVSLERAGHKANFTTAPDDAEEKLPSGLFQRFFAKETLHLPKIQQNSRFASTQRLHPGEVSSRRVSIVHNAISARSLSVHKRVYVVICMQKQHQYTPLDIQRYKERFDHLGRERRGTVRVSGKG